MKDIVVAALSALVGAILGSGGVVYFMRRSIEKRLQAAEDKQKKRKENEIERYKLDHRFEHSAVRVLLMLVHGAKKLDEQHLYFNGGLQGSIEELEKIEKDTKELDLSVIAEYERGK